MLFYNQFLEYFSLKPNFNPKIFLKKPLFVISKEKNKKKLTIIWNSISFHTFASENKEEKFELIATSLKNAKAVITTPLGTTCNYFSSLKI